MSVQQQQQQPVGQQYPIQQELAQIIYQHFNSQISRRRGKKKNIPDKPDKISSWGSLRHHQTPPSQPNPAALLILDHISWHIQQFRKASYHSCCRKRSSTRNVCVMKLMSRVISGMQGFLIKAVSMRFLQHWRKRGKDRPSNPSALLPPMINVAVGVKKSLAYLSWAVGLSLVV